MKFCIRNSTFYSYRHETNAFFLAVTVTKIIDDFDNELKYFVQVCPKEMIDKLKNPISTKTKIQKVS